MILKQERPDALLGIYHCPWNDTDFNGARYRILGLDYGILAAFVFNDVYFADVLFAFAVAVLGAQRDQAGGVRVPLEPDELLHVHLQLFGDLGNDIIVGGNGRDSLMGGEGNDTVVGGNGKDQVVGGAGLDVLRGGNGRDTLDARDGAEGSTLTGGDTLDGGQGRDTCLVDEGDTATDCP